MIDSWIALLEKNLYLLRIYELISPKTTPMTSDLRPKSANCFKMFRGVSEVISEFSEVYFITVLKRMMDTASLMMPSPNTMLKSLGYLS